MFAAALSAQVFCALSQIPATPDQATLNQAMVFVGGLVAVAVIGNQLMGAVIAWRKLKGSDPTDDKRYATRSEHQALRNEVGELQMDVKVLIRSTNNTLGDIQRSLGRLEGKVDTMTPPNIKTNFPV